MTENHGLSLKGAFLHDTQTADLCREQTLLEKARSGLESEADAGSLPMLPPEPRRPFRFPLPFCPVPSDSPTFLAPETMKPSYRLAILAPIALEGWVLRPVKPLYIDADASRLPTAESGIADSRMPTEHRPGFPAWPPEAGFLLGWWGNRAREILERARALSGLEQSGGGEGARESVPFRDFSVRVWYHAEIRLTLSAETPGFRSLFWETGKPTWIKAAR